MTENEAIKKIRMMPIALFDDEADKAKRMAIQALEEVQAYRAIGTVEELKTAMLYVSLAKKHGTVGKAIDSCAEYEAIGTVGEFKALKEKAEPKKPYFVQYDSNPAIGNWHCPTCNGFVLYSSPVCSCGNALDWS